jgi:hypothetical protein
METLKLPGGLYFAIIMDYYGGTQSAFNIALHACLYLAIIMDLYGWPKTAINIALPGDL